LNDFLIKLRGRIERKKKTTNKPNKKKKTMTDSFFFEGVVDKIKI